MPWCPKCKTEYKKGITVCVDCGTELVDEQPEMHEYSKLCTLEKEVVAEKLMKYFKYSNIYSHYEYEEAELGYVIYVREDEVKKAKKAFHAFYAVELEQLQKEEIKACIKESGSDDNSSTDLKETLEGDANDNIIATMVNNDMEDTFRLETESDSEEDSTSNDCKTESDSSNSEDYEGISEEEVDLLQDKNKMSKMMYDGGAYEKKGDKLKDLKSTAFTFFLFSIAGFVVIALNLVGVIDFIGGTLQYCILTALFIGFFLIGINSMQRIKKVSKEVVIEEENTKKITEWLNTYITQETLNEFQDTALSKEANFMKTMECIKRMVVKEFGRMDEAYLDYVTEDFYNNKFGEDSFEDEEI